MSYDQVPKPRWLRTPSTPNRAAKTPTPTSTNVRQMVDSWSRIHRHSAARRSRRPPAVRTGFVPTAADAIGGDAVGRAHLGVTVATT